MKQLKPSNFTEYPWDSIVQKCEYEIVAQNIMKILKRTGNKFREFTWDEYTQERKKDNGFATAEYKGFKAVIKYCKNVDTAELFSKCWIKEPTQ